MQRPFIACVLLAASSACASESHERANVTPVVPKSEELAPLPAPEDFDPRERGGLCEDDANGSIALIDGPRVSVQVSPMWHVVRNELAGSAYELSGEVVRLEGQPPAAVPDSDLYHPPREQYQSALLRAGDAELRVLARTRSLGLREGKDFEATDSSRRLGGWNHADTLSIRSAGETVLHHEQGAFPEDFALPDGMHAERHESLCDWAPLAGELYSVRITNDLGEELVLKPSQAGSIGDYDVYLWVALLPRAGAQTLGAIDAPPAVTELAFVRRRFHDSHGR